MAALSIEPVNGAGRRTTCGTGTWEQMREYFAHHSLYHLKEGDPHAWAIPRLSGRPRPLSSQSNTTNSGGPGRPCAPSSVRDLMDRRRSGSDLPGLPRSGARGVVGSGQPDVAVRPAPRARGAAIGHFAVDRDHVPTRIAPDGPRAARLGRPRTCVHFYREHVEADAVHEQVVRTDVVGDLVAREPHLDRDVVFGIRARDVVEDRAKQYGC